MKKTIYYFSGTGNSLAVARDIAERLGASLIPIAYLLQETEINIEAENIGIVFPVYFMGLPNIVKTFCRKLNGIGSTYIFAVCTYGGGKGDSISELKKIIRAQGGRLSAIYGIHMPQNSFRKPGENVKKILLRWKKSLSVIVKNTEQQKNFHYASNRIIDILQIPLTPLLRPAYMKYLIKETASTPNMPREELINKIDLVFTTNEKCTGCGLCAQVCPVNNIEIVGDKPHWLHHCEKCQACLNWCPRLAIYDRTSTKQFFYHHPGITVADILKQKKKT